MCMLTIVGYINYEYNEEREKNLGQTVYVSTSQGEIIKATNDFKNSGSYEYLFRKNGAISTFAEVKNILSSIQNRLSNKEIDALVTYNMEEDKYIIYVDKKTCEIQKVEEVLSTLDGIDVNKIEILQK